MNGLPSAVVGVLVVASLTPTVARALEPPPNVGRLVASLSYSRSAGAELCPDEAWLHRSIVRRLGEDPFGAAPTQRFRVEVTLVGGTFVGRIGLADAAGGPAKVREFEGSADCAELVDAMGLAISLAIKPDLVVNQAPEEPATDRTGAASPASADAASAPTAPPAVVTPSRDVKSAGEDSAPSHARTTSVGLDAGVFAQSAAGIGPSLDYGGSLGVRLTGLDALSVSLEGRVDAAGTSELPAGGTVKTRLLAGVLAPCWHVGFAAGCAVVLVGSFHAETREANAAGSDSAPYAAAGGRFTAEYPALPRLTLQIRADLLGTLRPPSMWRNTNDEVWSAPPLSVGLGLGVLTPIL